MKKELKGILQLLKTGSAKKEKFTIIESLKFVLKLITILVISYIFIVGFLELCSYYGMNIPHPDKFNELKKWSAFKIFLVGTIFAPILEEVTFRLPLRYSKIYISMLFGVLTALIIRIFIDSENEKIISYLIGTIFGMLFYKYYSKKGFQQIKNFYKNHPLFIFYFFLLNFSFAHLSNHSNITLHLLLISPILLLTKIAASTVFSYARLKFGIGLSIALHMINNAVATIFILHNR